MNANTSENGSTDIHAVEAIITAKNEDYGFAKTKDGEIIYLEPSGRRSITCRDGEFSFSPGIANFVSQNGDEIIVILPDQKDHGKKYRRAKVWTLLEAAVKAQKADDKRIANEQEAAKLAAEKEAAEIEQRRQYAEKLRQAAEVAGAKVRDNVLFPGKEKLMLAAEVIDMMPVMSDKGLRRQERRAKRMGKAPKPPVRDEVWEQIAARR